MLLNLDRGGYLILECVMSNKKSSTVTKDEEGKKKARNLYKALTNDSESVFYEQNKITKTLVKKARNSFYKKDTVFLNIYNNLEKKIFQSRKLCLLVLHLLKKDKTLFVQRYLVLVDFFNHYKVIQHTLVAQQGWKLTQIFVFYLLIYFLQKSTRIR